MIDIYGGRDPREVPIYTAYEAAGYVGLPPSTVRVWVKGQNYNTASRGRVHSPAIITLPPENEGLLTFNNLIEAYVLRALRTKHTVPMHKIRSALVNAQETLGISRLLLIRELLAGQGDIFLKYYGQLVNLSSKQLAFLIEPYLQRIKRDAEGYPALLYPVIPRRPESTSITIDPRLSFGRPSINGIATSVIANRYLGGDSVEVLTYDFHFTDSEIRDVIFYELAA